MLYLELLDLKRKSKGKDTTISRTDLSVPDK